MINYEGSTLAHMRSFGLYETSEVFAAMDKALQTNRAKAVLENHVFKTNSHRLELFHKRGTVCHECDLEANYFSLEVQKNEVGIIAPHLNLYHWDEAGEFVLFTKDHIIPRWYGGPNHLENYHVMCAPCNRAKSNMRPTNEEIEEVIVRLKASNVSYKFNEERLQAFEPGEIPPRRSSE